jgi:hypothetical protein
MLRDIQPLLWDPQLGHEAVIRAAAANLCLYGSLRPGECLPNPKHPERHILADSFTFYKDAEGTRVQPLPERGARFDAGAPAPNHFTIKLGPTKTDQAGTNPPMAVAAQPAVKAMWHWFHARRTSGHENGRIFQRKGQRALTLSSLLVDVARGLELLGHKNFVVTGKTFRKGAASALATQGARPGAIAAQLRHKSMRSQEYYISARARDVQARETN